MSLNITKDNSVEIIFQSLTRCTYYHIIHYPGKERFKYNITKNPDTLACPNNCSDNGVCSEKFFRCVCKDGWAGIDCSVPVFDNYEIPQFSEWKILLTEDGNLGSEWVEENFDGKLPYTTKFKIQIRIGQLLFLHLEVVKQTSIDTTRMTIGLPTWKFQIQLQKYLSTCGRYSNFPNCSKRNWEIGPKHFISYYHCIIQLNWKLELFI